MAKTIQLEIVTTAAPTIKAGIKQLYIPAYLGKAGVLENHKPYMSLLKAGEVFYTDILGKNHYLYIREGFLEARDNRIVIISDTVEKGEDLDKKEIEAKLAELKHKINIYFEMEKAWKELKKNEGEVQKRVKIGEELKKIQEELKKIEEELPKIPEELAKALEEQKEFETKLKILQKMAPSKH